MQIMISDVMQVNLYDVHSVCHMYDQQRALGKLRADP